MTARIRNRFLGFVLCIALSLSALAFGLTMIADAATSLGDISVWIIGGQSNAEGYGQFDSDDFAYDERFKNGFPDVLYWGNHENGGQDTKGFIPLTLGHGQKTVSVGAEVGIAAAVSQMGGKHAIIKCAIGSTYLYPYTQDAVSNTKHGTWTSPSFVNNYLANDGYAKTHASYVNKNLKISGDYGSKNNVAVGNMYNMMVELTLKPAIQALKNQGYNPVVRGMWWMQGEAETNISWGAASQAKTSYQNALTCFIKDIRGALTTIVGKDCSKAPFVIGRLYRNPANPHGKADMLAAIQSAQDSVAADSSLTNVEIVNPTDFAELGQHDAWHFRATTQKYLGEAFVNKVLLALKTDITTPYGTIPKAYANINTYPLAVFNKNGDFVAATNILGKDSLASGEIGAFNKARELGDGAVIYLRRDYTVPNNYSNLSQHNGNITLDLGGHKITQSSGATYPIFFADAKPVSGVIFNTRLNVKNGSISVSSKPVITFSSWEGSHANKPDGKQFDFTFDNVVFSGASSNLLLATANDETAPPRASMKLTINDCTFDLDGRSGVTVINASDAKNTLTVNAQISGGSILADKATSFTLFKGDETMSSSLKLSRSAGKYTTLTLPTSAAAPTTTFNSVNEGQLVFGSGVKNTARFTNAYKVGDNSGAENNKAYTNYTLKSKILGDFNVTCDGTLGTSLKMNIYVPKSSAITAISVDGKSVALSSLATKTVGGVSCYVVAVTNPSKSALGAVEVTVTAGSGTSAITPKYSVSLTDYAKTRLASTATAAEKTVIKDALSFGRAAMNYFGTSSATTLAQIDSLLGTNYDQTSTPEFKNSAVKPSKAMGFAGATLILGDQPVIRFYANGIDPAKAVFKQGSVKLTTKVGKDNIGSYVDVYLTYGELASDITYTVSGTNKQGAYNLRSYYEYIKQSQPTNTKLITLVERLGKYAESAKAN